MDIKQLEFVLPVHKEIQNYIIGKQEKGEKVRFNDLYEVVSDQMKEEVSRIAGMETEETKSFDKAIYFADCVKTLKMDKLTKEIERLTALFSAETDTEKRKNLTVEMAKLIAEKNKLR